MNETKTKVRWNTITKPYISRCFLLVYFSFCNVNTSDFYHNSHYPRNLHH